jgi:hypothetical protein
MNLLVSIPSPPMPGRADLMEAIRNAGGAKKAGLKKSEAHEGEETFEKPSKKPSTAAESTDDLMSSLSKALERRRKGTFLRLIDKKLYWLKIVIFRFFRNFRKNSQKI